VSPWLWTGGWGEPNSLAVCLPPHHGACAHQFKFLCAGPRTLIMVSTDSGLQPVTLPHCQVACWASLRGACMHSKLNAAAQLGFTSPSIRATIRRTAWT
jgi:hypothetical protein